MTDKEQEKLQLESQVQRLQKELSALQNRPAPKKSAPGAGLALLALLALALCVVTLFMLRGLSGRLEDLSAARNAPGGIVTPPGGQGTGTVSPVAPGTGSSGTGSAATPAPVKDPNRLYTPYELLAFGEAEGEELDDGITYVYYPAYFDGPRGNGKEDRRQDVHKLPDTNPTTVHLIFCSTFLGQHYSDPSDPENTVAADPGDYDIYWAKITLDDGGQVTLVERVPLDVGRFEDQIDANKQHNLIIIGGAKEEEQGFYALIAEKVNDPGGARYAYVSEIIELYIKD